MRPRCTQLVCGFLAIVLTGALHAAPCLASCSAQARVETKCCQPQQPTAPADACRDCILLHPVPAVPATHPSSPALPQLVFDFASDLMKVTGVAEQPARHQFPPLLADLVHMKCQLTT